MPRLGEFPSFEEIWIGMATDYDAPRKTDDDAESIEALTERVPDRLSGSVDAEDADNPGSFDLSAADLADVELETVVIPPQNDVDLHANDMNFIAIAENGRLVGFNLLVGGGLSIDHGNKKTYARTASEFGFLPLEHTLAVAEAVPPGIQRPGAGRLPEAGGDAVMVGRTGNGQGARLRHLGAAGQRERGGKGEPTQRNVCGHGCF